MSGTDEDDDLTQWELDCRGHMGVSHENDAFLSFVLLANILGIQRVAYGLELPTSLSEPAFSYYSNFPSDWHEKFVERHAKHHGSRVAYGKRTVEPDEWANKYYWGRADFQREAEANNITFDQVEETPGPIGSISFIGLAQWGAPPSDIDQRKARILIDVTVEVMGKLLIKKNFPQAEVTINELERRYLMWVLDGKTAEEIASILDIPKSVASNMQRRLPERFEKNGIDVTAFLAFRMGLLAKPVIGAQITE